VCIQIKQPKVVTHTKYCLTVFTKSTQDHATSSIASAAGQTLPPLHGVPDVLDEIATGDAPVVSHLKRDGAIVLGLTNTPEFSIRWFTSNPLHGNSLNP
jgi:Asp-tRNA(Asn)/Glu-tRNA(Gln) amidotransferase A subunit family amidase